MNIGIIGVGQVAQQFHIPSLMRCAGARVWSVCDVSEQAARSVAQRFHIPKVYTDYREMLADPELDAVSICTRNGTHDELVIACAKAHKHILCEKPMAVSLEKAQAMAQAVEENGVIFLLGMLNRFRRESMILTQRREQGRMGELYHVNVRWLRRRGIPRGWFTSKEQSGGGALIDIGVHAIDLAWYLMGRPKPISVTGMANYRLGDCQAEGNQVWGNTREHFTMDTEESAVALVRFEGNKTMMVTVGWALNGAPEDLNLDLYGTKEGARFHPLLIYGEENGYLQDIAVPFQEGDPWKEAFDREMDHFVSCVAGKTEPVCPAEDGLTVQRIIDGIYRSSQLGQEVRLEEEQP